MIKASNTRPRACLESYEGRSSNPIGWAKSLPVFEFPMQYKTKQCSIISNVSKVEGSFRHGITLQQDGKDLIHKHEYRMSTDLRELATNLTR